MMKGLAMYKYLLLLVLSQIAFAQPAVNKVQVNIHNSTQHSVEFVSFDSSRLFSSTQISEEVIPPQSSKHNVITFSSFDMGGISAGMNVLVNGQPMKLMWQLNMGHGDPTAPKSHMCGVIKGSDPKPQQEHCDIPYIDDETLIVDFWIE